MFDALIPFVGGILMLGFPHHFFRIGTATNDVDRIKKLAMCRKGGVGLIAISIAYALMAVAK